MDALLIFEIGPNGSSTIVVNRHDRKKICDINELVKVGSFKRFIVENEKIEENREEIEPILKTFYAHREQNNPGDGSKFITPEQVAKTKEFFKKWSILEANEALVLERAVPNQPFTILVTEHILRAKEVLGLAQAEIIASTYSKDFLKRTSYEKLLPYWVLAKLTNQKWEVRGDFDLYRQYFPMDGSKGVEMTVRELRSQDMVRANKLLTENSVVIINAVSDADFVSRIFLSGAREDELGPSDLEILGESGMKLVHPWISTEWFLDHKAAGKFSTVDRSLKDTINGRVKKTSQAFFAAFSLEATRFSDPYFSIWDQILTGPDKARLTRENRLGNPFATVKPVENIGGLIENYRKPETDPMKVLFVEIFRTELGTDNRVSPAKTLRQVFFPTPQTVVGDSQEYAPNPGRFVRLMKPDFGEAQKKAFEEAVGKMNPPTEKKKLRETTSSMRVSKTQAKIIDELSIRESAKTALKSWLRTFVSEQVQHLAFETAIASFENKGLLSLDDSEGDDADDDDDESK